MIRQTVNYRKRARRRSVVLVSNEQRRTTMTTANTTSTPDTILLVHGMWMTGRSWSNFVDYYTALGFRVLAPSWPGLEGDVEALQKDPTPLARLTVEQIVDHYERIIRALPTPPILMGHSFGGTIVQLLLDRGLGAAAVALHSGPVKGVLPLPFKTLRSTWRVWANPLNARRAVPMTRKTFHYAFANTRTREESDRIYDRLHIPAAGRAFFQGITANFVPGSPLKVNVENHERAPLLIVGGTADNLLPPAMQRYNAKIYKKSRAITEYLEMLGRSHDTMGQDGWEKVADTALAWALAHARVSPAAAKNARVRSVASVQLAAS
jgi:pimeloyl-ACP methyl ester carboxylesterase